MWGKAVLLCAVALAASATPALADRVVDSDRVLGGGSASLPPYLQCVPYARQVTGVNIFGDARTWWDQAEGRYARGHRPRVGAVMTFRPYGQMTLGHVAAVSRIIDSRTVLLRHANWSPINGRRGQIENDVAAVDVSPENDWSEVRVWFDPIQDLGTTHWPVEGFIYPAKARKADAMSGTIDAGFDPIGAIIAARLRLR
ncbi:MAG TPA: CHAP domain-containing protein [Novosphingobium sp.]|nr:CHAP domain-containing protein [Novosphingobium sp.]